VGYGYNNFVVAGVYATPLIATLMGYGLSHYLNDWILQRYIHTHQGIFEPEARLPLAYLGSLFAIAGQLLLGSMLNVLGSLAGVILGWGLYLCGVMLSVTAVYSYCSDCFPLVQGELSALLNLWRVMLGFAVTYFEVPWSLKSGALIEFGTQAGIILFATCILSFVHLNGVKLRGLMKPLNV
jgi:hypothetical protein